MLHKYRVEASVGGPIQISTTFLRYSFDGLKELLETKLDAYNAKNVP